MTGLKIKQFSWKNYGISMKQVDFKTNSKQYPDMLMPVKNGLIPEIYIIHEDGVSTIALKNFRIVFMNRVIKELQRFIKEIRGKFAKESVKNIVEALTILCLHTLGLKGTSI